MKAVLADTSAWIAHFREPDSVIVDAIRSDRLWTHEFVIAELALGSIPKRAAFLADLRAFQRVGARTTDDLITFVEEKRLATTGIGFVDASLLIGLAAEKGVRLWTRDKRLAAQAERLGLYYTPN